MALNHSKFDFSLTLESLFHSFVTEESRPKDKDSNSTPQGVDSRSSRLWK
jgi:hypothetical protein